MLRGDDDAFGHDHGNVSSPLCSPRANGQISMTFITPDPPSLCLSTLSFGVRALRPLHVFPATYYAKLTLCNAFVPTEPLLEVAMLCSYPVGVTAGV